ncbi:hypothetical protein VW35_17025 [Devosia soli]|uniref:Uncharacterized protein n=1 Tax=Devosia soli TaxID=361041 RepID=A0A0F5L2R7_9HYPH|nr:hypothetical protein [Devosia soli]KKB76499.1 hypothetical protein VW35_17025 [Devosia soli]
MSTSLDTNPTSETTNAAIATDGMVSITEQVKVEPSNIASPAVSDAKAITLVDADGMLEVEKRNLSERIAPRRLEVGADATRSALRGDKLMLLGVSWLALAWIAFPGWEWAEEVKRRDINTGAIKSKHKLAFATAATFNLDPSHSDPEIAKQHGQLVDRLSLAGEGLVALIEKLPLEERNAITFDDEGAEKVVPYLKKAGGINAVAAATRADNNKTPAERNHQIALDPAKANEYLAEAGKLALLAQAKGIGDNDATVTLALAINVGDETIHVEADAGLADTVLAQALKAKAPVDPVVDTIGEILQVGRVIEEVETDKPKDHLADPKAEDTEMRDASRHVVFMPDGTMRVSAILNPDSPVVLVQTSQPVLPKWPTMPCHLQAQSRRIIEANIINPDRRKLFKMRVVEPGKTLGHCRLVFATEVAVEPRNGKVELGVLVEPLRSKQENYPLDVRHGDFAPDWEFPLDLSARQILMSFVSAIKTPGDRAVSINMNGSEAEFVFGKTSQTVDAATPTKGKVSVMARHLRPALMTIATLPLVKDSMTFAADRDGAVRIAFGTARANYAVFLPAVMANKSLSNRYFTPIKVK